MLAHRFGRCAAVLLAVVAVGVSGCTDSNGPTPAPARTPGHTQPHSPASKPNIVFVLTDDLSMNLISHMPHVRALQRAGTTMSRYYVVDSLCCPSRSAIFTGEYPHNNGVFKNTGRDGGYSAYNRNGNEQRAFAVALRNAGYRTALMGKYLNGYFPKESPAPGYDEWDVTGLGYGEFDYTLNHNGNPESYANRPQDYLVDVLSARGAQFIGKAAADRKPFMLEIATFAPHAPYVPAPRYADAVPSLRYPRTTAYDTLPTAAPSWLRGRQPLTLEEQAAIDADYRQRVRADLAVDDLIANLQKTLRAKGIAGNTYFVFSSDNGYHMGENRLLPGKQSAFDTDIHVPLIVAGPGVPAGATVDSLASNIDLAPTFESLGHAPVGSHVDGTSLASLWHASRPASWQDAVLIEHHGPNDQRLDPDRQSYRKGNPPSYEAVRTSDALYVRYRNGEQEYYDTRTDPYERRNLAAHGVPPAMIALLRALQQCRGAAQCQAAARMP